MTFNENAKRIINEYESAKKVRQDNLSKARENTKKTFTPIEEINEQTIIKFAFGCAISVCKWNKNKSKSESPSIQNILEQQYYSAICYANEVDKEESGVLETIRKQNLIDIEYLTNKKRIQKKECRNIAAFLSLFLL